MEELLKTWKTRMEEYRNSADAPNIAPMQKVKEQAKFMLLRDCIRELEQLILLNVSGSLK